MVRAKAHPPLICSSRAEYCGIWISIFAVATSRPNTCPYPYLHKSHTNAIYKPEYDRVSVEECSDDDDDVGVIIFRLGCPTVYRPTCVYHKLGQPRLKSCNTSTIILRNHEIVGNYWLQAASSIRSAPTPSAHWAQIGLLWGGSASQPGTCLF